MKHKKLVIPALLFCLFISFASAQDQALEQAVETINHEDVYNFCRTLASPEFEGRYPSHQGYHAAAKWAAANFTEWGLKPISEEVGFLQPYPCPITFQDEAAMTLIFPEREVELEVESEFLPYLTSGSGSGEVEVVFAGWGVSAPEAGYDDFANIDVKGKFVMFFSGSPRSDDPRLREWLSRNRSSAINTAREKGAVGILSISTKEPIVSPGGRSYLEDFCNVRISDKVADMLLEEKGVTSVQLKQNLTNFQAPISFPLGAKVKYRLKSRHISDGMSYNIVGYVEGSDPELKKECFYMFAHFDHFGPHYGRMFYGANDNASGSAVVMQLAKAFGQLPKKPKRSMVFVLFTAEELGLGTSYFTNDLPAQFTKIDGVFNYDMVGVGDYVNLNLNAQPAGFKELVEEADKSYKIVRGSQSSGGSSRDYPYLYFASAGGHTRYEFYHRSSDTIYRINPEIMFNISRLSFRSAYPWANR